MMWPRPGASVTVPFAGTGTGPDSVWAPGSTTPGRPCSVVFLAAPEYADSSESASAAALRIDR